MIGNAAVRRPLQLSLALASSGLVAVVVTVPDIALLFWAAQNDPDPLSPTAASLGPAAAQFGILPFYAAPALPLPGR